jgi:hypothetical protein
VRLPEEVMRDPNVPQELMQKVVPAEKRMQAGLEDVAVAVAPRRKFSAQDIAFLEYGRAATGVSEKLRGGKPGYAAADDECITGAATCIRGWGFGRDEQN